MQSIKGKKLLILAGSVHECDLVRRAKELGVYTIVTDYYDVVNSPAKQMADEYWNISWSDIDTLTSKCQEEKIDGVTAGYSESTVECLIKLCQKLSLPCYCNEQQLNIMKDKILFKETCRQNGVPVVKEYSSISEVDKYPVIIKPVDRGGSIGVGIASNEKELKQAYQYAMEMSYCKRVIIEEYINDGTKFDAYYAITDGNITFLSTSDTINAQNNSEEKVIQSGWFLPSKYQDIYLKEIDKSVRMMISNLHIHNGFIFLSGFARPQGFVFFETGFRLSGGHMYQYFVNNGASDIQDIFIRHALTGSSDGLCFSMSSGKKALIINYYAKEGTLSQFGGWEDIKKIPECGFVLPMCKMGTVCHADKAILTKLGMVHLYSNKTESLLDAMDKVNKLIIANDEEGNDMIFDRMRRKDIVSMLNS